MKPQRIQLSRAKGFNLQAASNLRNGLGAVHVARPGPWGNPFIVGEDSTRAECVHLYRLLLSGYIALTTKGWQGTAMIVRTAFLEGVGRYERLFALNPPTIVAQFTERVPMVKGRLTATGSTATAYCWLVWMANASPKPMVWIAPCRKRLERPGDYAQFAGVA